MFIKNFSKGNKVNITPGVAKSIGTPNGELHGAIINVTCLDDEFIGETAKLIFNDEVIATKKIPNNKDFTFTGVQDIGTYKVSCEIDGKENLNATDISMEDIFYKNIDNVSLGLKANFTLGNIYKFDGCEWMAVKKEEDYVTVIMTKGDTTKGKMGGYWPGYVKNGNNYSSNYYNNFMADSKCQANYPGLKKVYDDIKSTQYSDKGFYLVSNSDCNQTVNNKLGSGKIWEALTTAAANYSSFGAIYAFSWLGTVGGNSYAWCVDKFGTVTSNYQSNSCAIAPAFDLDITKVKIDIDEIKIK